MLAIAVSGLVLASCSASSDPVVTDVRMATPTGPNTAVYLTASGADDVLLGASVDDDIASVVELHTTTMTDGMMTMSQVSGATMAADSDLVLEPGGLHLMLVDVVDLEVGDTIEVTLQWETFGPQVVEATVVDPADTVSEP